jgi:hypothetical protein
MFEEIVARLSQPRPGINLADFSKNYASAAAQLSDLKNLLSPISGTISPAAGSPAKGTADCGKKTPINEMGDLVEPTDVMNGLAEATKDLGCFLDTLGNPALLGTGVNSSSDL